MTIYERIRNLRISLGMSQEDLAHKMGYKDRSMITKIESGNVDISQKKIVAFANVLSTSPAYLMGWTENPSAAHPDNSLVLSSDENHLVTTYRGLTPYGKQLMMDRAAELTLLHGEKESSSVSYYHHLMPI